MLYEGHPLEGPPYSDQISIMVNAKQFIEGFGQTPGQAVEDAQQ
jgi:hypothetical protein